MINNFFILDFLHIKLWGLWACRLKPNKILSMAKAIIISLRKCELGIENLNKIVLIMKNWHEDPRLGYAIGEGFNTMGDYLDAKNNLFEKKK
jgi:hypothetical protein